MTALAFLTHYWRELAGALLVAIIAGLLAIHAHDRALLRECKAARLADQEAVRTKTAEAQAADVAHARTVENRNATITQESERDLQGQLADARAAADRYAAQLRDRAKAGDGGRGVSGVPSATDPAVSVADANRASLLDADLRICSENTVKAEGWRTWWTQVSATDSR